jgi:hypothetical protein
VSALPSLLESAGAAGAVLDELLAYCENPYAGKMPADLALPMADEPHLADWDEYASDAKAMGVIPALEKRLVQLLFPIEAGISQRDDYRAATRRGEWPAADTPSLLLIHPDRIHFVLHPTPAGRIPILTIAYRGDFETLVQAFSCRNEPEPVPASMGACIVSGLNNWDRVRQYRKRWETETGNADNEAAWGEEFKRLVPRKELYQDRFLLLSTGPYSAVPAGELGMDDAHWLATSIAIRREHECFHYLTRRAVGGMRNHLIDELLADFVGLVRIVGGYNPALARRFLGIEDKDRFRPGGRLGNYRGEPALSDPAFAILCRLADRCVTNLAAAAEKEKARLADPNELARFTLRLYTTPLEILAG